MADEDATAIAFVRQVLDVTAALPYASVRMFVIIDQATSNATRAVLQAEAERETRLTVIWAPENRCVVDAYLRGYAAALAAECDWILEIDAGFSHAPSEIHKLVEASVGADCVFGSRFCAGGRMEEAPIGRRLISYFGGRLANLMLGTRLTDMTSGFQLFNRRALLTVLEFGIRSRGPFFQTEIKLICHRFNVCEVPITYRSPSYHVGMKALADAAGNLLRLTRLRLCERSAA